MRRSLLLLLLVLMVQQHTQCENAGWFDFLGGDHKPASILLQKMLAKFEIMLESDAGKHVKMKNAG